jgi:hypothetical protein
MPGSWPCWISTGPNAFTRNRRDYCPRFGRVWLPLSRTPRNGPRRIALSWLWTLFTWRGPAILNGTGKSAWTFSWAE